MAQDITIKNRYDVVFNRAFNLVVFSVLGYMALRVFWVWRVLDRSLPEGHLPVLRFLGIAGLISIAPGLGLLRLGRARVSSLSVKILLVIVLSLSASACLFWHLYLFGIYTKAASIGILLFMGCFGLYGLQPEITSCSLENLRRRWTAISRGGRVGLLIGLVFLQGLFETAVGLPMVDWDALVSWDKWAVDMANRSGLGQYIMGGYPQLLPTLHSVFYKLAGTGGEVLPPEHLLLHGFNVLYVAVLMLSLWVLGRFLRFSWLVALAIYVLHRGTSVFLANGYVDTPLAAFVLATCAIIVAYNNGALQLEKGVSATVVLFAGSVFFFL